MRVVVTRAFGVYSKGHIIPEMPGGQARDYILRGLVAEAAQPAPLTLLDKLANAVRGPGSPRRKAGER